MARKTSFYYSFLVLPADQRRAIIAVWDLCRAVDDAVDEEPSMAPGMPTGGAAVPFWRDELSRIFAGQAPETDQGRRLQPFVRQFDLPRQAFEDVIDGVAMDLDTTRYQTFDDLFEYCRRVASAVGMICIRIWGCRSERSREYALNLGVALQLTNILRDVKGDLERGRVYLPLADLARFGLTPADLRPENPEIKPLVAYEVSRARRHYALAAPGIPLLEPASQACMRTAYRLYSGILDEVAAADYDVFRRRATVPSGRRASVAIRSLLTRPGTRVTA